jgi:hypothetical protein
MNVRRRGPEPRILDPTSPDEVLQAIRDLDLRQSIGFGAADDARSADVERVAERRYLVRTVHHLGTRPVFTSTPVPNPQAAAALVKAVLWPRENGVRAS